MVVLKPNVVRGGRAIGLGNNLYLMKGRTHSKGGIDIGKNPKTGLEVENNEVMQVSPQGVRVFSAQPILGGISPAQYILGGANPNQVFNAQEQWKKVNRINDDGTRKAKYGKEKRKKLYNSLKDKIIEQANTEKLYTQPKIGEKPLQSLDYDIASSITEVGDVGLGNEVLKDIKNKKYKEAGIGLVSLLLPAIVAKGLKAGTKVVTKDVLNENFQKRLIKEITDEPKGKYYYNVKPVEKRPIVDRTGRIISDPPIRNKIGKMHIEGEDIVPGKSLIKGDEYIWLTSDKPYYPPMQDDFIKIGVNDSNATIGNILSTGPTDYPLTKGFSKTAPSLESYKFIPLGKLSNGKMYGTYGITKYKKYGGIHIKPSKRGTFTAAAKKHGMSVQGFASKVLANKGKYSSAMVKKANFARNASKWKHKEFGGDMDFNYWITKDNIYKLGGRKKALIGDDMLQGSLIVANNGSNLDAARNKVLSSLPTTKSILTSFRDTLTPVEQKINKEQALRTIMSNQKDGLGTSGLPKGVVGQYLANGIQTAINIGGNIGSYLINRDAIRRMRGPAAPLPLRAEILPTRVSTAAQEAALRENVAKQENLLSGNLSSSRSRLNATNQIRNQGIGLYNQLQERKGEIERELITRDKLNRQGITNQNIAQVNQWRNASREFENKRIDLNSENTIQHLIQGPTDAIAGERGFFDNLASNDRYRMTAFLEAIKNPDALNAMNSDEIKQLARRFGVRTSWLRSIGINI